MTPIGIHRPYRASVRIGFCVAMACGVCGCGNNNSNLIENPGFESSLTSEDLPRGWSFSFPSGKYKHEKTDSTRSGKHELLVTGSGGEAQLQTNAKPVPNGSLLECEAWLRNEETKGGQSSLAVRFVSAEDSSPSETGIAGFNPKSTKWQRVHFYCRVEEANSTAMLEIRLTGEGRVRIDDLMLKPVPHFESSDVIADKGFENVDEKDASPDWDFRSETKTGSFKRITKTPHRGKSCVRIEGTEGWGVLLSRRTIPPDRGRVIVQGFIRTNQGRGQLKVDYFKNGRYVVSSFSAESTGDWDMLSVESKPELLKKADAIHVTLSAVNDGGPYSVDFDDLDVFIVP